MAKFKDTEVLTKQVYLNIKQGDSVETRTMPTAQALQVYGEKEVVFIYEPRYTSEQTMQEPAIVKRARKDGIVPKDTRKDGVTDVILA